MDRRTSSYANNQGLKKKTEDPSNLMNSSKNRDASNSKDANNSRMTAAAEMTATDGTAATIGKLVTSRTAMAETTTIVGTPATAGRQPQQAGSNSKEDSNSRVYLTPSRPPVETLFCKNHEHPSDQKSLTWAPLTAGNFYFFHTIGRSSEKYKYLPHFCQTF